jgi:PilZ domain-containing protein
MLPDQHLMPRPSYGNQGVRRHFRYPFSVPVTLRHLLPHGFKSSHGMTVDISEGGLGAILHNGLRVGQTVRVDLPLPGGALNLVAIVRHTSSRRSGLEFLGLTPEDRQRISTTSIPTTGTPSV